MPWLPGGVSPSAYEIWPLTSAQLLQSVLQSSPAAPSWGNVSVHLENPALAPPSKPYHPLPAWDGLQEGWDVG